MARKDQLWDWKNGTTYAFINCVATGLDLLIKGANRYLNFGSVSGVNGYGIRDNGGTMEVKSSGGAWATIADSGSGQFITIVPTETPNGAITVFTFPSASGQPSYINRDGTLTPATAQSGVVYWTWNAGTKQATMMIPPTDILIAIV